MSIKYEPKFCLAALPWLCGKHHDKELDWDYRNPYSSGRMFVLFCFPFPCLLVTEIMRPPDKTVFKHLRATDIGIVLASRIL